MTITPLPLGLRSNPARHGHAGAARLINCYAELIGDEGKAPWTIHACDGFKSLATLGGGAIRAGLVLDEATAYVVAGRHLYRIDQAGAATLIGGIPSSGPVSMARNRAAVPQIAIVAGGLYFGLQGNVLTQLADPDLPPPVCVAQLNGYFSFLLQDGRHFASELDDWDVTALSFAAAGYNPDQGVASCVRGQDLLIFGTGSMEAWADVGADPYPFQRSTAIDVGLLAARSIADVDQTIAFVAHDGTVRMLNGYQAVRISSHALERAISREPNAADIAACSWQSRGHTFYALSGMTWTWVWDSATQLWHERASYGLPRWRVGTAMQFGRKIILGDYAEAKLYELAPDAAAAGSRIDQVLMMDYSDDGGATWSTQRTASLGTLGDRLRRARFNRLGTSRSRTYRLSMNAATEAGQEMIMTVQTPPVADAPHRLRHNALHVDAVPGLGGASGAMSLVRLDADLDKLAA